MQFSGSARLITARPCRLTNLPSPSPSQNTRQALLQVTMRVNSAGSAIVYSARSSKKHKRSGAGEAGGWESEKDAPRR
jgi:hypothetical protein